MTDPVDNRIQYLLSIRHYYKQKIGEVEEELKRISRIHQRDIPLE